MFPFVPSDEDGKSIISELSADGWHIGRSKHLNETERETLAHNNQRRNIKVITYDELLDDFGTLILHRLDDTRA
jgi:uncharacterized membrane protein YheB (UPF0754 family)